ncbi:MAG: type IV toxin-antitoxin system AbiEi family antitoxin [Candidatus Berkiella sp.]
MVKKANLSKTVGPTSARVLNELFAKGKVIFALDDVCEIYGRGRQETSHFLRDLVNRGVLARIKSGVFLILQMGQESAQLDNWPIIARALAGKSDYFISHYSAMRLHGMTTHPLMNVIITMPKRNSSKKVHHLLYQFIYSKPSHFWGMTQVWVTKQEKVSVSDIERTILDGLDRPDLCGGIKEIARGIWNKQIQIDWNKMVEYGRKYHSKAAVKRLGYILENLKLGLESISLLEKIIFSKKDYILLDPNGSKSGTYLSRWRIRINMNIDEITASVWE